MTEIEAAWLAGLLEGEGCFTCEKPTKSHVNGRVRVNLTTTDKDIAERAAALMRSKVWECKRNKPHHKVPYRVTASKWEDVKRLLHFITPYLGERRSARVQELTECIHAHEEWVGKGGLSRAMSRPRAANGEFIKG